MPEGIGGWILLLRLFHTLSCLLLSGYPSMGSASAKVRDDREKLTKVAQELFILNMLWTLVAYVILAAYSLCSEAVSEKHNADKFKHSVYHLGVEWLYQPRRNTIYNGKERNLKLISLGRCSFLCGLRMTTGFMHLY